MTIKITSTGQNETATASRLSSPENKKDNICN